MSHKTLWLSVYLFGWYACNSAFNVYNKKALNAWKHPWLVSWLELVAGVAYVLPMWGLGLRKAPKCDTWLFKKFAVIGSLHSSGHAMQVAAMGAGSVFMANVVKAMEPIVGTAVGFLATGKLPGWKTNTSLVPIVLGVTGAAMKPGAQSLDPYAELRSFATLAAFGSTVVFAIAKLMAKRLMTSTLKKERGLDAGNNYALLTCSSCTMLLAPALYFDGSVVLREPPSLETMTYIALAGILYYASNEFSFRVLDLLDPVPQAVANAAKRVFVLFAAVVFLGETVTPRKLVGSSVALVGVLCYGLSRSSGAAVVKKAK